MKNVAFVTSLFLCGCGIAPSNDIQSQTDHEFERLTCVDSEHDKMKFIKDYQLVFFARNFGENVQVWLQPKSGRTVVTKSIHTRNTTCYVFDGFPTAVYNKK